MCRFPSPTPNRPALADAGIGQSPQLVRFESIDSTNRHARREIEAGRGPAIGQPVVFVARTQTAAIGQFGRPFVSPVGGLWLTVVARLDDREPVQGAILDGLGERMAEACRGLVQGALDRAVAAGGRRATANIKPPNDILVSGRKVLGVLTEVLGHAGARYAVIGVGLNANFRTEALPKELQLSAGTLLDETGVEADLEWLAREAAGRLLASLSPNATGC